MIMIAQEAAVSQDRLWSQIVARVWSDEEFKQRFKNDPRGVLAEHGIDTPEGVDIRVVEDSPEVRHIVLPPPPVDELTDEELIGTTVAYCYSGACGRCGCGCGRCRCNCL
jgi:hypothetical protein